MSLPDGRDGNRVYSEWFNQRLGEVSRESHGPESLIALAELLDDLAVISASAAPGDLMRAGGVVPADYPPAGWGAIDGIDLVQFQAAAELEMVLPAESEAAKSVALAALTNASASDGAHSARLYPSVAAAAMAAGLMTEAEVELVQTPWKSSGRAVEEVPDAAADQARSFASTLRRIAVRIQDGRLVGEQ